MVFNVFKRMYQNQPFILSRDLTAEGKDPQALRNQLTRWQKKGLIVALRKGVYLLNTSDRRVNVDPAMIANILYTPSYLSLEYALSSYGLIPERVRGLTSVTTLKTKRFQNEMGTFIYQHIKPEAFRGFQKMGASNGYFMAEPEKAVADFLYFNLSRFRGNPREVLEHSYRFQNIEEINPLKLMAYGKLFKTKKLNRVVKALCAWIKEAKR